MSTRTSTPGTWLALVAMLLLVAMPVAGRLLGNAVPLQWDAVVGGERLAVQAPAGASAAAAPMHHAAHAMHGGHAMHTTPQPSHAQASPDRVPPEGGTDPHRQHDGDCAYCPLLSGLAQAAAVPTLALGPMPLAPWSVRVVAAPPAPAPVPALGPHGPPRRNG